MTHEAIARRYAHALFDVARRNRAVAKIDADLQALDTLVSSHEDLKKTFDTPAIPPKIKRAIVDALVSRLTDLAVEVQRLVSMLADHDRLMLLHEIAAAYTAQVQQADRVAPADVVTAVPLGAERLAGVAAALGQATGLRVTVTERVDPSIVGGMIARVGNVVFDGSVTRQLERMRERLRQER